jgi:hypothetical protein
MPQVTTKGDLLTYSTGQDRLPVGTNGYGLFADSTQSTGLRWGLPYQGLKNVVMNGNFNIWQRGTSFTPLGATFGPDRWVGSITSAGSLNVARDTSVPTFAQSGVNSSYSMKVTVASTDTSVAASDHAEIHQGIEGYYWALLQGKAMTLSFWVKSSKTGTYCVSLRNVSNATFIAEYSINAANTWEYKTISISASATGTWSFINLVGAYLAFSLMAGTSYQAATGWTGDGTRTATSNQANFLNTISDTFYLAQVQLEAGSVATAFEARGFQQELAACQRYYQKTFDYGTAPAQNAGLTGALAFTTASGTAANNVFTWQLPVRLRSTGGTVTTYNPSAAASSWRDTTGSANRNATTVDIGEACVVLTMSQNPTSGNVHRIHVAVDADIY